MAQRLDEEVELVVAVELLAQADLVARVVLDALERHALAIEVEYGIHIRRVVHEPVAVGVEAVEVGAQGLEQRVLVGQAENLRKLHSPALRELAHQHRAHGIRAQQGLAARHEVVPAPVPRKPGDGKEALAVVKVERLAGSLCHVAPKLGLGVIEHRNAWHRPVAHGGADDRRRRREVVVTHLTGKALGHAGLDVAHERRVLGHHVVVDAVAEEPVADLVGRGLKHRDDVDASPAAHPAGHLEQLLVAVGPLLGVPRAEDRELVGEREVAHDLLHHLVRLVEHLEDGQAKLDHLLVGRGEDGQDRTAIERLRGDPLRDVHHGLLDLVDQPDGPVLGKQLRERRVSCVTTACAGQLEGAGDGLDDVVGQLGRRHVIDVDAVQRAVRHADWLARLVVVLQAEVVRQPAVDDARHDVLVDCPVCGHGRPPFCAAAIVAQNADAGSPATHTKTGPVRGLRSVWQPVPDSNW